MSAYYNENDPKAAAWLRRLIAEGHIAPGEVDERSIEDIVPYEIKKFTQCHFFAGIGVWSYALRLAGWPDDRPVWTGSCPCQPFSQAGKGAGTSDERHLWPAWYHLVAQRRPSVLFGEQVASPAAGAWADLVQDDLEAVGYAFGAVPFPAASVGAPHIRDRLYWAAVESVDYATGARRDGPGAGPEGEARDKARMRGSECGRSALRLADDDAGEVRRIADEPVVAGADGGCVENTELSAGSRLGLHGRQSVRQQKAMRSAGAGVVDAPEPGSRTGLLRGQNPWADCEFVWCRDGKWRPVEPGTFPLAHGAPARVGRLRGYGNAIVAQQAQVFIEASGLV